MKYKLEWVETGGVEIVLKVTAKDDITLENRMEVKVEEKNPEVTDNSKEKALHQIAH